MSATPPIAGALKSAFEHPTGGVVGLVDDLLRLCADQGLQLDWQIDRCRIRSLTNGAEEVLQRPVRPSVFRAVLARVATLCNDRKPASVSPYGGQGELASSVDPAAVFQVSFTNTAEQQILRLTPVSSTSAQA